MKLIPSADKVIIKITEEKERTIGNIILPQTHWAEYSQGVVISVGPGPCGPFGTCPMTSKPGDSVIFPPTLGRRVPVRQPDGTDVEYMVMAQHEISMTVMPDDAPDPVAETTDEPPAKSKTAPKKKAKR